MRDADKTKTIRNVSHNTIFARRLEAECLKQFNDCISQDGVLYGALMPDAHVGYSAPIGSAIVTGDRVFPAWVGQDIGCGILSVPTNFKVEDIEENGRGIFRDIEWTTSINNKIVTPVTLPKYLLEKDLSTLGQTVFGEDRCFGFKQLGTLGSGNHFAEIGVDLKDMVWITVHSGSRGTGHQIATAHMKLARQLHSGGEEDHPCFREGAKEFHDYINDVGWLLSYASINRHRIVSDIVGVINTFCEGSAFVTGAIESNHNHLDITNKNYIHRKGCTQADRGEMVNIAANMRDGVYLGRGKGRYESLYSCSHGAGRYCSRTEVKKLLDPIVFKHDMRDVICHDQVKYLDESPRAYKDIGTVLELQGDLISVTNHITPLINVRG